MADAFVWLSAVLSAIVIGIAVGRRFGVKAGRLLGEHAAVLEAGDRLADIERRRNVQSATGRELMFWLDKWLKR